MIREAIPVREIQAPMELESSSLILQDRGGTSYSRQGIIPHKAAHDNGIRRIVHLLGKVSDQHGNRKGKHLFDRIPHGHINRREEFFYRNHIFTTLIYIFVQ